MGLYNFQERFVPKILSGEKRHTIRAKRKHPDKPGNPFHGYVGLRTKQAEKIASGTVTKVEDIRIIEMPGETEHDRVRIIVQGLGLEMDECEVLARADGFDSFADMRKFWNGRLPFSGDIIHWKDN